MSSSAAAKQRELRKAILDLPLGQLAQFAQKGIEGQPLHRALGFPQDKDFKQWLLQHKDQIVDSEDEEERALAGGGEDDDEEESGDSDEDDEDDSEEDDDDLPANKRNQQQPTTKRASSSVKPPPPPAAKRSRSAPSERSSKKAVSRTRQVVVVPRNEARDPRFTQQTINGSLVRNRYEFLEPQRDAEIVSLRTSLRQQDALREAPQLLSKHKRRKTKRMTDEELDENRAALTRLEQHRGDTKRARDYQVKLHDLKKRTPVVSATTKKKLKLQVRYEDLAQNEHRFKRFVDKKRKEGEYKERKRTREAGGGGGSGPLLGV